MRITIKDIAKNLHIHHSTVSRALRMDPRVKYETSEMIRNYAKKHGYYPNINALKLRGTVKNMIALIVPEIDHRFFSNIINFLTDLTYNQNYVLSIYQSNESFNQECSFIEKLIQQDVAGVIASVSKETTSGAHFRELNRMQIPLVFFDRVLKDVNASRVTTNNRDIAEVVIAELVRKGRKRIAHITGPDNINVFHDRNIGYKNSVIKYGTGYLKQIILDKDFSVESGVTAASELFAGESCPDAIISTAFMITMGVVRYLNIANVNFPQEVKVVGFGDKLFNSLLHPDIISIEQPEKEMAYTAFQLLLDQLEFKENPVNFKHKEIELKCTIQ